MDFIALSLVVLGLILAFAGRRFLWLFIGLAGFVLGYTLAEFFFSDDGTIQLIVGVGVGIVGAFLARKFTTFLLGLAGFILVGSAFMTIGEIFGLTELWISLLLFVVGGLVGIGLARFSFSIAVIVISALGGASLVMQGLPAIFGSEAGTLNLVLGVAVALGGMFVQWRFLRDDGDDDS